MMKRKTTVGSMKSDLVDLVYDLVNDIDKAETLADLDKLKRECGLRHNK